MAARALIPENKNEEHIEGRNPVLEAMRGPRRVTHIYLSSSLKRAGTVGEIEKLASEQQVPLDLVPADEIFAKSRTGIPQGVIATVVPYRYYGLKDISSFIGSEKPGLVVALDGVEDPRNFGSILRLADATGVNFVITEKRRSCGVTPAVSKSSAGAVEHVKIVRVPSLANVIERLKKEGFWVVGADPEGDTVYYELDYKIPVVFVLGGEGEGIGRLIRERCDFLARLPQFGEVGSLNVSATGAVLLYEAVRQRVGRPGGRNA
ncbi:MAG: 23S rRNA (guanosine(2251)-2'-O)-methyltransferase RlmB [Actinobacteria bacterium]|nr:23S rRNA (guanosine(2251)-2'-O)-methyltransferase RlmB [Actinomycetota bacterium]